MLLLSNQRTALFQFQSIVRGAHRAMTVEAIVPLRLSGESERRTGLYLTMGGCA